MTIANATLEMKKGNVEVALTMLRGLEPTNPHYNAAHKARRPPPTPCLAVPRRASPRLASPRLARSRARFE